MDERTKVDCLANARALAPAIAAAAVRIEAARELPADLVEALHEARLFRMLVPRSLGGEEISPVEYVQVIEEIAKADASTAWCIGQTSVCSTISKAMHRDVAEEIFKKNPRGVLAWGPTGNGMAVVADGGFRVSGVWPFASGSRQATWLAAHCIVHENKDTPRRDANGKPVQRTLVVPRQCAKIDDVWHVIGLKGTGSDTYTLSDVFVPQERAIGYHALNPSEWHERGALYLFTIYQLFGASFPAVALGIARAALDAFCALAQKKTPTGQTTMLRDNPVIQSQVGIMQSQLAAARAFFLDALGEIWQAAQSGAFSIDQRVRLRMACINLSQQSRQVVETAYLAAGATAVFEKNPFERRLRDMHAVSQQAQSQLSIYEAIGRHFLGLAHGSRLI
ncbi:MAG: acyl-CoA dehydrogenase family protein [Xanthobacteraceae bacterium]